MTDDPGNGRTAAMTIIEDLFLTDAFLIKGRMANKHQRLTRMLEEEDRTFVSIEDAVMVSLGGAEVVRTPRVLVNRREIVFAHELVDIAGDPALRTLAANDKNIRVRAFYSGTVQLELSGRIEDGAYEPSRRPTRRFFVMQEPVLRGLDLNGNPELRVLKGLSYAIVQKDRLSYVYDLS